MRRKEEPARKDDTVFHDTENMMDDPFRLWYYLYAVAQIRKAAEMYLTGVLKEQALAYQVLDYWYIKPFVDEIHAAEVLKHAKYILQTYDES